MVALTETYKKSLPNLAVPAIKRNSLLNLMESVTSQTTHQEEVQLGFRLQCNACIGSSRYRQQHCIVVESISGWQYREIMSNKLKGMMTMDESLSSTRVDVSI